MLQCLGIALLGIQVVTSGSAAGISVRALILDVIALACRLSSTLWLNGYLPVDASGDFIYQGLDLCSLGMMVWLLHQMLAVHRRTYQEIEDTANIAPMVLVSLVLAAIFHSDMDDRP